jgi:hypothetical protein
MVTLVEFLSPVKGGSNRDRILGTLYFAHRQQGVPSLSVDDIRKRLVQARIPRAARVNVADVLAKAGEYVDAPDTNSKGARLWRLTDTGEEAVRKLLGLPETAPQVEHDVAELSRVAASVKDPVARGYIEEAILCLQVGALRAATVFLWTGAIRSLQEDVLATFTSAAIDAAITKHDPKARPVRRVEDFAQIKDKISLLALRDLGVIDKGEWGSLQEALDLRNRCGHPTKYVPKSSRAAAFIEDVVGIVF